MQLNEIVEQNSIKDISLKTNISEDHLQNLLDMKFETLKKVKTMGFISILEREYSADLDDMKQQAKRFYIENIEEHHYALDSNIEEENDGKSKLFIFAIILIFAYASWYFFTQFDKGHLTALIPSKDDVVVESNVTEDISTPIETEEDIVSSLSITNVVEEEKKEDKNISVESTNTTIEDNKTIDIATHTIDKVADIEEPEEETNTTEVAEVETPKVEEVKEVVVEPIVVQKSTISIIPTRRLWFGMTDMTNTKRDQFSIAKEYKLDVTTKSWLIATSPASFSTLIDGVKKYYKGGKPKYLKISKDGVEVLTKREYRRKGGWRQW